MPRDGYVQYGLADYLALEKSIIGKFRNYLKRYKRIYLYGAGEFGRRVKTFLMRNLLDGKIEGFLVTDKKKTVSAIDGLPVLAPDEASLADAGVVLALSVELHPEVQRVLRRFGCTDVLSFEAYEYTHMGGCNHRMTGTQARRYSALCAPQTMAGNTVSDWKNILLVCQFGIGDEIINIPFIRELRRNCCHDAKITMVATGGIQNFMQHCPYIDEIIPYDHKLYAGLEVKETAKKSWSFAKKYLQPRHFDAVFLHGWSNISLEALFLAAFSGAPNRIGFSEKNLPIKEFWNPYFDLFFSLPVMATGIMHEVERFLKLLEATGGRVSSKSIEFWTDTADACFAEKVFRENNLSGRPVIAVVPQAQDKARMWDKEKYLTCLENIRARHEDVYFLILGGTDAKSLGAFLVAGLSDNDVLDMTGRTSVCEAAEVLRRCCLYLGCNTGLMHVAAAVRIPTVEIICHAEEGDPLEYSSPDRYRAWGNDAYVVRPKRALPGCGATCYARKAHCINQISVEEVTHVVDEVLSQRNRTRGGVDG